MLIREGDARSFALDRRLACLLALIAGSLNSAGFYAVGFFSANMTGNVSTMADRVAVGDILASLFYLAIVVTFVLGAALSTFVVNLGKRNGVERIYAFSIMAEAAFLALLGCADRWMPSASRAPVLVLGLSFLMGAQNAIVTCISNARVRTTHVSGIATDVGIELGRLAELALRGESTAEAQSYREKLRLHGATILSFCVGGILGVVVYRAAGAWLLFGASALLISAALPAMRHTSPRNAAAASRGA